MTEIGKRLGRRIRELRTARAERWTQEDLAERARISVSFLSMIERGERMPHVEMLASLCAALEVSLSELFDGTDGAPSRNDPSRNDDLLRPLAEFARSRQLTAEDVEKLLGVARAMFDGAGR